MTTAITLNDLIATRLAEIAEDAWEKHRALRIAGDNGRIIQLGTAAVWELWRCEADHGSGPCHEPLLTTDQAATLAGQPVDYMIESTSQPTIEVTVLDPEFGFQFTDLYHLADVVAEYQKAQG
jgi:hypothetical protein